MLNKLRKIHTIYQFFVVFWEPFAKTCLLESNRLFFFNQRSSKVISFVQSSYHDPVFPLSLLGAELMTAKEYFVS